jgi:16S rRNA processing protein RimM
VRGWVKVHAFTEAPDTLLALRTWWLRTGGIGQAQPHRVLEGRLHAGQVVAKLEGIATREDAAGYKGVEVQVPREALPETADDEVYAGDLVGCKVVNRRGEALGVVIEVQDNGAQSLLRVAGGHDADGRLLIPVVPAHVQEIDLETRTIVVDWEADY